MKIHLDNIGKFISHVTGHRNKLNPEGFELRIKTGELISAKKDLEGLLIQAENQKDRTFSKRPKNVELGNENNKTDVLPVFAGKPNQLHLHEPSRAC